jgi:hypothetical protein
MDEPHDDRHGHGQGQQVDEEHEPIGDGPKCGDDAPIEPIRQQSRGILPGAIGQQPDPGHESDELRRGVQPAEVQGQDGDEDLVAEDVDERGDDQEMHRPRTRDVPPGRARLRHERCRTGVADRSSGAECRLGLAPMGFRRVAWKAENERPIEHRAMPARGSP